MARRYLKRNVFQSLTDFFEHKAIGQVPSLVTSLVSGEFSSERSPVDVWDPVVC